MSCRIVLTLQNDSQIKSNLSKTFAKTQGEFHATLVKLQVQIELVLYLTTHHEEHILTKENTEFNGKRKLEKVWQKKRLKYATNRKITKQKIQENHTYKI